MLRALGVTTFGPRALLGLLAPAASLVLYVLVVAGHGFIGSGRRPGGRGNNSESR
jgi:hypothetical protein